MSDHNSNNNNIDDLVVVMPADENLSVSNVGGDVDVTLPPHYLILRNNTGHFDGPTVNVSNGSHTWTKNGTDSDESGMIGWFNIAAADDFLSLSDLQGYGLCDSNGVLNIKAELVPNGGYGLFGFNLSAISPAYQWTNENLTAKQGWAVSDTGWQQASYDLLSKCE